MMTVSELERAAQQAREWPPANAGATRDTEIEDTALAMIVGYRLMYDALVRTSERGHGHGINAYEADEILAQLRLKL